MSKLDFRDGVLEGKYLQLVGARRSDTSFVRKLVTPHDPMTVSQLAYRSAFASLIDFGNKLPNGVLNAPTMVKPYQASVLNRFMHDNNHILVDPPFYPYKVHMHKGSLYLPASWMREPNIGFQVVIITWTDELLGEAQLSDSVRCVVINKESSVIGISPIRVRSDKEARVYLAGDEEDELLCWLFLWKENGIFSNSLYDSTTYH